MFCEKCGTKLSDGVNFCDRCGAATMVADEQQCEPIAEAVPNSMRKRKILTVIIAVFCGLVLISACIAAVIMIPLKGVNSFKEQIQSRSYMDALATYESLSGEDRTKANKWLSEYILDIEQDYYSGKLDYSTASNRLSELIQFDAVFNQMTEAGQNVYLDNQSTIAFEEAKEYADAEKWKEAYLTMQDIHIKYRLYDDVAELREKCAQNFRTEVLEQINAYAANKEIDMLITARDDALKILADDIEIIQACQTHLNNYVDEILAYADKLAKEGDYTGAIKTLTYASSIYPNQEFTSAMDAYHYESTIAYCEGLIAQNNLLGAVLELKSLVHMDARYQSKYSEYGQALVEKTLSTAKTYADKRQFAEAIDLVSTALSAYDNSELQAAYERYNAYLPRQLSECHQIDCSYGGYVIKDDHVDSFGKEHQGAIRFKDAYQDTYAVYSLEGKYINLAGTIVADEDHKGAGVVKIYVDDKLVYQSRVVTRTTEAVTFSVNITGGKQLRIEVLNDRGVAYWSNIIVDAKVS